MLLKEKGLLVGAALFLHVIFAQAAAAHSGTDVDHHVFIGITLARVPVS